MTYPRVKVGEIAAVKGGKRLPKGKELVTTKTKHPYIRARDIRDGLITFDDPVYVTDEVFEKIKRYTVRTNDVCITIVGVNVGDVGITPDYLDGANLTENAVKLTNLRNCDPEFLCYSLLGEEPQAQMKLYAAGAAQAKLGLYKIKEIEIPLPPLPTQRKIAAILSAYDDLIENNTRRIALLEQMAQLLYREWFVRFRFPGHEDARMVASELGEIPEGWEVKSFTDEIDVLSGGTPRTSVPEYWNGEIPWMTPKDIQESFYILDTERKITELGLSKCNSALYPADTVFITARGTVGRCVLAAVPMAMSQTSYALIGHQGNPQHFVYLLTLELVEALKKAATGAVFDTIIVDTFRSQYVAFPLVELRTRFAENITPLFALIKNLQKRNATLRRTRDLLLPRLIAGEVDVAELEIAE